MNWKQTHRKIVGEGQNEEPVQILKQKVSNRSKREKYKNQAD